MNQPLWLVFIYLSFVEMGKAPCRDGDGCGLAVQGAHAESEFQLFARDMARVADQVQSWKASP